MLRFAGWTAGTLFPSCPMYDLFDDGRFKASIVIIGSEVTINRADYTEQSVTMPYVVGASDRARRRAIVRALIA